jgi:glycosyltransferase involved in cell wall biosynthesis
MTCLRILFVKEAQNWPRSSGNDVHGFYMMQTLAARGHWVSLATVVPPSKQALEGLPLESLYQLDAHSGDPPPLTFLQRRFVKYYGVRMEYGTALARIAREWEFDAVVMVSRHLLPLLCGVRVPVRVWYPADDPALHHLTRFNPLKPRTWGELINAAVNVVYERAFRACYDRVWVVSPPDRTAVRLFAGCRDVDLMPNGVDTVHYQPMGEADIPNSCVFWGRLDFDPNVDALEWFITRIWPAVVKRTPAARFAIFGFNPRERVKELARKPGVELYPDVHDLRPEVTRRQVAILPFVSGGGIKNKLLEAAALGMPIACTQWALSGTRGKAAVQVCRSPVEWAESLARVWENLEARKELGAAARKWVIEHHTWEAAAHTAEQGIEKSMAGEQPGVLGPDEREKLHREMIQLIESLQRICDHGQRLVSVDLALFQGDRQFVTAVCLKFEFLTAVFKAMPDYDTLAVKIAEFEVDKDEEVVSATASHPWATLIGGKVVWGWRLTNQQGYTDGVRLEFIEPGKLQTRGIIDMVVGASMIEISEVVRTDRS